MSVLVNSDLDEDGTLRKLNDAEIFSFVLLLSVAGTETVARLLGWAGSLLDEHPDERAKLVEDPSLIPNAVEECLRFEAPSPVNGRWVNADVEFHGQVIPKDSKLLVLNGSGNRDERHFPDADRFDVTRQIDRHLSFGYGAHFCVGAALARLEGHIALRELSSDTRPGTSTATAPRWCTRRRSAATPSSPSACVSAVVVNLRYASRRNARRG